MANQMFCFQCEQTAGCTACTGAAGVCGKKADTAKLQDQLTGALIGLARATEGNESLVTEETDTLVLEGLFTTITNVNFNNDTISDPSPAFALAVSFLFSLIFISSCHISYD